MEAAILTTFPGTISSFRQQAGRAGRRKDTSLVVLVAGEDALDQYFMTHPDELFTRPSEAVVINPSNPAVAEAHAACAAYELPLRLEDREVLGEAIEEDAYRLVQADLLRLRQRAVLGGSPCPAPQIVAQFAGAVSTSSPPSRALGVLDRHGRTGTATGAVYHQGTPTW